MGDQEGTFDLQARKLQDFKYVTVQQTTLLLLKLVALCHGRNWLCNFIYVCVFVCVILQIPVIVIQTKLRAT